MSYDTAAIRRLLTAAITDQELEDICFDYFPSVQAQFSSGMARGKKIQTLIGYCRRHEQFDKLLLQVQRINPERYDDFIAETGSEPPLAVPVRDRQPSRPADRIAPHKTPSLSRHDKKRLFTELGQLPQWLMGGIMGERAVLSAAGLPQAIVYNLPLTGIPQTDAVNVITSLEKLGHLDTMPTHYALGALIEHLLDISPVLEGKLFMAYLLERYPLISSETELNQILRHYALLKTAPPDVPLNLGWETEQPAFDWQTQSAATHLERIWDDDAPMLEVNFLIKGSRVAQSVCVVENKFTKGGTGFLVGPDLVLTNYHVVSFLGQDASQGTRVRFGFLFDETGQLLSGKTYKVVELVHFSPEKDLDFALLRLDKAPQVDCLPLEDQSIFVDNRLYIIQHPLGAPQKIVLQGNKVTYVDPDYRRVQYLTNTQKGSSGAPAFNDHWEVVALHHSAKPFPPLPQNNGVDGNEGIPISAILPEIWEWM